MCPTIFTVEQVSVNSNSTMTDVQEEQFIGQREKFSVSTLKHRNLVLIQQSTMVEFRDLFRSHVFAHVQTECNLLCTWSNIIFAMHMEIAEINKDSKSLRFEIPLPDVIGN